MRLHHLLWNVEDLIFGNNLEIFTGSLLQRSQAYVLLSDLLLVVCIFCLVTRSMDRFFDRLQRHIASNWLCSVITSRVYFLCRTFPILAASQKLLLRHLNNSLLILKRKEISLGVESAIRYRFIILGRVYRA